MLDRLWSILADFIGFFKFWWMCDPYEYALIISGGKVRRKKYLFGPGGWGLILPGWEKAAIARTDIQTFLMLPQTLMTSDGQTVTVRMGCVWQLENVEMFLLRIADDEQAMYTQCYCALSELVRESQWSDLLTKEWHRKLWKRVKERAANYGVKMLEFELVELAKMDMSIRLFNETGGNTGVYFGN